MEKQRKDVDGLELSQLIDQRFPGEIAIALRNLFALGCLLVFQGHREQGLKACNDAIRALGPINRGRYLDRLIANVVDDPIAIARTVGASAEVLDLFNAGPARR